MKIEKFQNSRQSGKGRLSQPKTFLAILLNVVWLSAFFVIVPAQTIDPTQIKLTSTQFVTPDGLTVERLVETAFSRRADLLAARQRLVIAEGKLTQAGLRLNPVLDAEYGSPRFLGGEAESDFSVGVSQVFELGGKRIKRVKVAELEIAQIRAEVTALERQFAAAIRTAYASAIAAARQLDVLEKLIIADEEIVRVTDARLKQGDVAPLDLNLVKVESDRLRVQTIESKSNLESAILTLQSLTGADVAESLKIAPQTERPPRLDLGLTELTATALRGRSDLQAAKIAEQIGAARIDLAKSLATPNVAASVKFSRNKGIIDLPVTAGGVFALNNDNALTFGVSVELPFFNRNQGEIASATGEQIQATRNREFLEASIKRDVAIAYRKYRAAAEKLVLYSTQILPRSEENLRTVRAAYNLGEFSVFEVVNEQRRLTENLAGYNESLRDYYTGLADLEAALGAPLPASAFADDMTSILPNKEIVPNQIDKDKLLNSLFDQEKPASLTKLTKNSKPKNEEDKK